jgi:heme A synthase
MTAFFEIHRILSNTIWMFYLAIAIWGLIRAVRARPVDGSYFGAMAVIQIVVVLQVILGAILYADGARPGRELVHYLYGAFSVVFLPGLFAYLQGDDSNRAQWIYALASLFMFGVTLRIIGTAT